MKRKKLPISKKHLRATADELWRYACIKKWGSKCFCGEIANHCHHFFPRSNSALLRLDPENCVPICNSHHLGIHWRGDPTINQEIIKARGKKWYNRLLIKSRQKEISINTIKFYQQKIKELKEIVQF